MAIAISFHQSLTSVLMEVIPFLNMPFEPDAKNGILPTRPRGLQEVITGGALQGSSEQFA